PIVFSSAPDPVTEGLVRWPRLELSSLTGQAFLAWRGAWRPMWTGSSKGRIPWPHNPASLLLPADQVIEKPSSTNPAHSYEQQSDSPCANDQRPVRNGPHSVLRRKLRTLYQIDQLMRAAVNGIPVTTLITRKISTLLRNRAKKRSPVRNK